MLAKFNKFVETHNLVKGTDRVLLAISGGADSMCLANLLLDSKINFGLAHCNFELRGEDSDADEQFVSDFATRNNIPIYIKHFATSDIAKSAKTSIEETARNLRYQWFDELCEDYPFTLLATAHHQDDNVETFLLNLLKGRGINGQTGILPKSGKLIRPLLFASKNEILAYCEQLRIQFRTDVSNMDVKFQRNFLRHQVVPLLKHLNPSLNEAIEHEINFRRAAVACFQDWMTARLRQISDENKIDLKDLRSNPNGIFLLFKFLQPFGFNFSQIRDILDSEGSGRQFFSSQYIIFTNGDNLFVKQIEVSEPSESVSIVSPKELINPVHLVFSYIPSPNFSSFGGSEAFLDASKIKFPLTLRRWQKGDFFFPVGMRGKKKLSDFFTDKKLNLIQKQQIWLLYQGVDLVWIVGWRVDRRFAATESSKAILKIEWVNPDKD